MFLKYNIDERNYKYFIEISYNDFNDNIKNIFKI